MYRKLSYAVILFVFIGFLFPGCGNNKESIGRIKSQISARTQELDQAKAKLKIAESNQKGFKSIFVDSDEVKALKTNVKSIESSIETLKAELESENKSFWEKVLTVIFYIIAFGGGLGIIGAIAVGLGS